MWQQPISWLSYECTKRTASTERSKAEIVVEVVEISDTRLVNVGLI